MGQSVCPSLYSHLELDPYLIHEKYMKNKTQPYNYILEIMKPLKSNNFDFLKYQEFFKMLTSYYNNVPYHNINHAFDVMIMCDRFLIDYKMIEEIGLTQQQRVYILIAAYAHDNGHEGLTNHFYITSENELAIKYSNISPLENMHSSNLLSCLRSCNITVMQQYKELMVSLILATDNKHHFQLVQKVKQYQECTNKKILSQLNDRFQIKNSKSQNKEHQKKQRQTLLQMIIHTSDLSPCAKPREEYIKWYQRLYQQFKFQYEKERDLKLHHFMFNFDLKNEEFSSNVQNLNFLNNMALPLFKQVSNVVPPFWTQLNHLIETRNYFLQKVHKYQKSIRSKNLVFS